MHGFSLRTRNPRKLAAGRSDRFARRRKTRTPRPWCNDDNSEGQTHAEIRRRAGAAEAYLRRVGDALDNAELTSPSRSLMQSMSNTIEQWGVDVLDLTSKMHTLGSPRNWSRGHGDAGWRHDHRPHLVVRCIAGAQPESPQDQPRGLQSAMF